MEDNDNVFCDKERENLFIDLKIVSNVLSFALHVKVFLCYFRIVISNFKIVSNFNRLTAREITYNNFEISLVVFMPNITTNHAIIYTIINS